MSYQNCIQYFKSMCVIDRCVTLVNVEKMIRTQNNVTLKPWTHTETWNKYGMTNMLKTKMIRQLTCRVSIFVHWFLTLFTWFNILWKHTELFTIHLLYGIKVILCSNLILKKMNKRIINIHNKRIKAEYNGV